MSATTISRAANGASAEPMVSVPAELVDRLIAGSRAETVAPASTAAAPPPAAAVAVADSSGGELIAVPAGLFTALLGAVGGAIGRAVGGDTGATIGGIAGGVVGSFIPLGTIPPASARPASAGGPQGPAAEGDEALVVLPAGFFGSLLRTVSGAVGSHVGGSAGRAIDTIGGAVGDLLPFTVVPPGGRSEEELIMVPADFFGSLLGTVSRAVGGHVGGDVGDAISTIGGVIGDILPFSALPPQSSAGAEDLVAIPAGLIGSLLGTVGRIVGKRVGGATGSQVGGAIGDFLGSLSPFSIVAPQS